MTKNQKSHLNCMLAVLVYLDKFTSIFSDAKLIVEMIGTLKGKVELINTIADEQERNQKGKAINKKQIRDRLIESMVGVGGALRALAVSENDPEMAERVKMRVDQLRNLGPKLVERAKAYEMIVVSPRDAIARRKTLTALLKKEVKAEIDLMHEAVSTSN